MTERAAATDFDWGTVVRLWWSTLWRAVCLSMLVGLCGGGIIAALTVAHAPQAVIIPLQIILMLCLMGTHIFALKLALVKNNFVKPAA